MLAPKVRSFARRAAGHWRFTAAVTHDGASSATQLSGTTGVDVAHQESSCSAGLPAVHLELRGRVRSQRFVHDALLRQLGAAALAGQLDPVEWRKLRSSLADAAPELRPGEVASALQGLVALRSVEHAYLTPVVRPLRHMAHYMSGQQLVTTLAALGSLASPGSFFSEAREAANTVAGIVERRLLSASRALSSSAGLTVRELLDLLRAMLQLDLLSPRMMQALLGRLPPPSSITTRDTEELLALLCRATDALKSGPHREREMEHWPLSILGVLIDIRSALRIRLKDLSQVEVLHLLVQSVSLEAALDPQLQSERLASCSRPTSVEDILLRKMLDQLGVVRDGAGFHRLLLGELRQPAEAIGSLSASESVDLFLALALLTKAETPAPVRAGQVTAVAPRPLPAYLARMCPPLVERTLQGLEALRPEELLQVVEVLVLDLGYEDDYLGHRLAEALVRRLVPVWVSEVAVSEGPMEIEGSAKETTSLIMTVDSESEEPQDDTGTGRVDGQANTLNRAEQLSRALGALAWLPRPVGFADLLSAALEDLDGRVAAAGRLGLSQAEAGMTTICSCLGCHRSSAMAAQHASDEYRWLQTMQEHFRSASRKPSRPPMETTHKVADWALARWLGLFYSSNSFDAWPAIQFAYLATRSHPTPVMSIYELGGLGHLDEAPQEGATSQNNPEWGSI